MHAFHHFPYHGKEGTCHLFPCLMFFLHLHYHPSDGKRDWKADLAWGVSRRQVFIYLLPGSVFRLEDLRGGTRIAQFIVIMNSEPLLLYQPPSPPSPPAPCVIIITVHTNGEGKIIAHCTHASYLFRAFAPGTRQWSNYLFALHFCTAFLVSQCFCQNSGF